MLSNYWLRHGAERRGEGDVRSIRISHAAAPFDRLRGGRITCSPPQHPAARGGRTGGNLKCQPRSPSGYPRPSEGRSGKSFVARPMHPHQQNLCAQRKEVRGTLTASNFHALPRPSTGSGRTGCSLMCLHPPNRLNSWRPTARDGPSPFAVAHPPFSPCPYTVRGSPTPFVVSLSNHEPAASSLDGLGTNASATRSLVPPHSL